MMLKRELPREFCVELENKSEVIQMNSVLNKLGYEWADGDSLLQWFPPEHAYPLFYRILSIKRLVSYDEIEYLDRESVNTLDFKSIWEINALYREV